MNTNVPTYPGNLHQGKILKAIEKVECKPGPIILPSNKITKLIKSAEQRIKEVETH